MGKRTRGRHARLGTVTGMLHKLKKKYKKAEQIGMRKAIENLKQLSFLSKIQVLFFSKYIE